MVAEHTFAGIPLPPDFARPMLRCLDTDILQPRWVNSAAIRSGRHEQRPRSGRHGLGMEQKSEIAIAIRVIENQLQLSCRRPQEMSDIRCVTI